MPKPTVPMLIVSAFALFVGVEVAVYQSNPDNDVNNHLYRSGVNYLTQHHLNVAKFSRSEIIAKGQEHDNDALDSYAALKRDERNLGFSQSP